MEETLIILGTGNATVTKCYNTCFAIQHDNDNFLVDAYRANSYISRDGNFFDPNTL